MQRANRLIKPRLTFNLERHASIARNCENSSWKSEKMYRLQQKSSWLLESDSTHPIK